MGSVSPWYASGPEIDPCILRFLSWKNFPLPMIQESKLSVTGKRIGTKYW